MTPSSGANQALAYQQQLTNSSLMTTTTTTTATALTSAKNGHQSSGGGNAKYLRYVRSKLSKSRLNSVLSLSSGGSANSNKENINNNSNNNNIRSGASGTSQNNSLNFGSLEQQGTPSTAASGETLLMNPFDLQSAEQRQQQQQQQSGAIYEQQQQLLLSTSGRTSLARSVQVIHLGQTHKPISVSLSSELAAPGEAANEANSSVECKQQKPAPLKQQASISKKSNFFSGFRSTLRGRRSSKQVQQQQQPAKEAKDAKEVMIVSEHCHQQQAASMQVQMQIQSELYDLQQSQAALSSSQSLSAIIGSQEQPESFQTAATAQRMNQAMATSKTTTSTKHTTIGAMGNCYYTTTSSCSSSMRTATSSSTTTTSSGQCGEHALQEQLHAGDLTPATSSSMETTPEIQHEAAATANWPGHAMLKSNRRDSFDDD